MNRSILLLLLCSSAIAQPYRYSKEGEMEPWADGIHPIGNPTNRWSTVYANSLNLKNTGVLMTLDSVLDGRSGLELAEGGVMKWGIVNRGGSGDALQIYADDGLEQDLAIQITQDLQYTLRGPNVIMTLVNTNTFSANLPFGIRGSQFAGNTVGTTPVADIQFQRDTTLADNRRGSIIFKTNPDAVDTTEWMKLTSLGSLVGAYRIAPTPSAEQPLLATSSIAVNAGAVRVRGAGGSVLLTSLPHITPGNYDNQKLQIEGTDNTNTVTLQDNDTLPGSGVELNTPTRTLKKYQKITLSWNAADSKWTED